YERQGTWPRSHRLRRRTCQTDRRPQERRNRNHPGLSWPRRDDPSRRLGFDAVMTAAQKATANASLAQTMREMGTAARQASRALAHLTPEKKSATLHAVAKALRDNASQILA